MRGPRRTVYLVTFQRACTNCDGPSGITIEKFDSAEKLKEYRGGYDIPPAIEFAQWPESLGVAIITGHRKHEFVKALKNQLMGIDSKDFGKGPLDEIAAETILEEMYEDSVVTPELVKPCHSPLGCDCPRCVKRYGPIHPNNVGKELRSNPTGDVKKVRQG
jgi:hypothetical protein